VARPTALPPTTTILTTRSSSCSSAAVGDGRDGGAGVVPQELGGYRAR
jgi:hypothetical protein